MKKLLIAIALTAFFQATPAAASELEGDFLYKVSTLRAAPGSLAEMLEWIAELKASAYFTDAGTPVPFIARHSQGDHWDLMIITPMGEWSAWYAKGAVAKRNSAADKHAGILARADSLIAFDEDVFAYGPSLSAMQAEYSANAMLHIEMFHALPGKTDALFEQRRMENRYLLATGQKPNMIFRRDAGSDVDVFTIGFHRSLEAFSTQGGASAEESESAARASGFKDRADISFYLRSLLSSHHDTLAVKVE